MKDKKSTTAILISCVLLVSCISANNVTAEQTETNYEPNNVTIAKWTVMYYICGDLIFFNADCLGVMENLTEIGSTDGLNILVMKDGIEVGDTQLILINNTGGKEILNEQFGWPNEVDTGNPNTLELFCKLMMNAYPAEHYAVVLVAPGTAGWQVRSLHDQRGTRGPSWPTFSETLKNITNNGENKIDVIFIESCVLGLLENAYEIAPYADYMITSEEHIPDGDICIKRYYEPLWDLKNNTDMTPEEFVARGPYRHNPVNFTFYEYTARRITKIFDKLRFERLHTVLMHTTCSAVNLSKVDALAAAVDDLASFLTLYKDNKNVYNAIKKARSEVREYGKGLSKFWFMNKVYIFGIGVSIYSKFPIEMLAFDCWVDLYNLVDLIKENVDVPEIKNKCLSVMEKLNDSIIANKKVSGDESHGLSIYFPSSKKMYNQYVYGPRIPSPYENLRLSKNTMWDEFLKDYLRVTKKNNNYVYP